MKSSLKNMVLVLFTITAVSAFLVALVNDLTKDTIEQKRQQTEDLAKLEVLPAYDGEVELIDTVRKISDFEVVVTTVKKSDGETLGYAVKAPSITRNGYADRITLMVGFVEQEDSTTLISGVKVLSQKETPGLGANMIKPDNKLEASIKRQPNPAKLVFKVKKDDASGSFDALTGSTISSRAYVNAVETAYAGYLWATGRLDLSKEAIESAPSGASTPSNKGAEDVAATGATTVEECGEELNSNVEPEAQKGELSNE